MDLPTANTYMVITIYLALFFFINQSWATEIRGESSHQEKKIEATKATHFSLVSIDYLSWQQEGKIKSGSSQSPLIITNQGVCAGGAIGYDYRTYRTFIDGCFIYGSGNAGSEKNTITYNQSGISVYGLKASLGMGKIVSSARTEIGFKLPIMYVQQNLTKTNITSIHEPPTLSAMASLYSRWPFEDWFVQTEFSKIIGNDLVLFSLGGGYQF